jgi:acetolactate synthase I/II/III large subunit
VQGAWKKPFSGRADLVIALGFRFWSGEKCGQPPTWTDKATYVQIDATPARIGWQVSAEVPVVGDPKLVLRQLIEAVKARKKDFGAEKNAAWRQEVNTARANFRKMVGERAEKVRGELPIHPDRLIGDLVSVADKDATIVVDSFTLSGYISHHWTVRFPGQIVDAGPLAPVGHGIGMGIGAQLGRPGKQVICVIGDGGIGIGGWDMETAAKYKIPLVVVLWNNSSWGPSFEQMPLLKDRTDPFDMLPGIRYDRIFQELGCHGEHVETPDQIIPALKRAFDSGKPAVINVVGDKRIGHPTLGGNLLGSTQV